MKFVTFLALYVCVWLSWELGENPTRLPTMLIHLWLLSSPLDVPFLTLLPCFLSLTVWISTTRVSLLTDQHPLSFSDLTGSCRHNSSCGFHDKIDNLTLVKMLKIRSLLWPPIREHTHRSTHIHPYIYIYIYIHFLIIIKILSRFLISVLVSGWD